MRFEGRFDIYTLFMILGVFQGLVLSYFYLSKKNRSHQPNIFWGLFLLTLTIIGSEILLNYSGYIVKVIWIENYSEPFVFLLSPLLYFIIKSSLDNKYEKQDWIHFMPFVFYFVYCFLYFLQSPEFKYNSYLYCYQPDWNNLPVKMVLPEDPLGLRGSLAQLYLSQFLFYIILIYQLFQKNKFKHIWQFWKIPDKNNRLLVTYWLHYIVIFILITFVKIHFERDLGDYIIGSYLSVLIYLSSFVVIRRSLVFSGDTFQQEPKIKKYEKSSLNEEIKKQILDKLTELLGKEKYFTSNTVSLSSISKAINEKPHHISQVINEKLGKNFFDLLAEYRVEEAKKILRDPNSENLTIEEVAEQVGYNSKAAFNKVFKSLTGLTPSEFKNKK